MSLLTEAMEDCRYIDKTTQPDGYGGVITVWANGASFQAAVVLMSSTEVIAAAAQDTKSTYNILTDRAINLKFGEIIQRVSDGKYFRITQDGDDDKTPKSAGLNLRKVTAEEIKALPT